MTEHSAGSTVGVAALTLVTAAALATLAGAQSVGVPDPDVAVTRPVDIQSTPRAAWVMPDAPSSNVGSQEGYVQRMFGPGDAVVVSAGAGAQFTVGDEYSVPVAPVGGSHGEVDHTDAARILFTEEGGYTAGIHRFAVIDRGRNANMTFAQRFTLFREVLGQQGPVNNIGEAFAVDVGERTATVRSFGTRDAVYAGDRLAAHR